MSRGKIKALYFGYGFREESTSLFEKIGRDGIAAAAASRMGLREDPLGHLGLIPIEPAFPAQRGQPIPPAAAHSGGTALFLSLPEISG
jgi:hypothetical protein